MKDKSFGRIPTVTGRKKAIVIGAGAGGVATAARLAKANYEVEVYERNDFTGGRCSLIEHDGHRFDRGPSLLLLPDLFRETFDDLGTTLEAEGVELLKCEPNYRMYFHDGQAMILSTDTAVMKAEVERHEGAGGFERYLDFLREAHVHYTQSVQQVLKRPFSSLTGFLRPSLLRGVLALHPASMLYARASMYFRTERLRRAFTFGSMYMGMSPFEAPATYSLLQYTELAEGIWYPRGGFHRVVQALVDVGKRLGVKYHLATEVACVNVDPVTNRATGISLANGETRNADVVVINADLVTAYSTLLPQDNPKISSYAARLRQKRTSCSSISFYWSLSASTASTLSTHNVFLAEHYGPSFDQIFRDNHLPDEPSFYINCPSHIDPSASPSGRDTMVVLVPCGHLDPSASPESEIKKWARLADQVRTKIIDTVKSRAGLDLAPLIEHEIINTPATWATSLNLDRGAILGLAHDFFNVLAFRPRTRARGISGQCWFVGASTHPGTGVPIVLAGAKLVVDEILAENRNVSWATQWTEMIKDEWTRLKVWQAEGVPEHVRQNQHGTSLDRIQDLRPAWNDPGFLLGVLGVLMLVGMLVLVAGALGLRGRGVGIGIDGWRHL